MKSVTIHQLDDHLARMIAQEAARRNTSMNKTIKALLAQAMGAKPAPAGAHRPAFEKYCGMWSAQEFDDFSRRAADMAEVDPGDWA